MLSTHMHDQVTVPITFGNAEVMTWRRVTIDVYASYFLVNYKIQENGRWSGQTMLLHFERDLISFFDAVQEQQGIQIRQIALLSPSTMNSSNGWMLETLSEIWCATHAKGKYPVLSYVTDDGRRYSGTKDEAELALLLPRLLYVHSGHNSTS